MTRTSPTAGSLTINRHFAHPIGRVFSAFADDAMKAKWFTGPDGAERLERQVDIRPGGSEVLKIRWTTGMVTHFVARYHAVEAPRRMVYSYDLMIDDAHHSTSLAVVELSSAGGGTDLVFTEFVAWHDGTELQRGLASREHGTLWLFDKMAAALSA